MNQVIPKDNRTYHLDFAAGILMLWIITFHAVNGSKVFGDIDARVAIPFLTFSMPWFFYKSGTFFRRGRGKDGLERDVNKLLLPFLKWTALGLFAYLLMMAIDGTFTVSECISKPLSTLWIYGYLPLDVPLWFVLSLFNVKIIAHFLFKSKIHPVFFVVIGFGIAFLLHIVNNPHIPVWLANIPMGLAFFSLGFLVRKYEAKTWLVIPSIVGYLVFVVFDTPVVGLHRNVHLSGNYYLWPIFSLCGIIAFNNICKWICNSIGRLKQIRFHPISLLGKHSLILLVTHAFVYMPVLHYSKLSSINTFLIIEGIYFLILIPLILVVKKR